MKLRSSFSIPILVKDLRDYYRRVKSAIYYPVRDFFFPYNVIKIQALPRSWTDRDDVMFHAIFQIIVDFVELEQPYVEWKNHRAGRFTDLDSMKKFIEWHLEEAESADEHCRASLLRQYATAREILYLYEWYSSGAHALDKERLYDMTGQDLSFTLTESKELVMEAVDVAGAKKCLTWDELWEIERERDDVKNVMLRRVLDVRKNLWT